jgi:GNAT superfamily N-acetyltransferase
MLPEKRAPLILSRDHAGMLDRFLMTRPESSLMLLSNLRRAGLEDRDGVFQGTYAAYVDNGGITGVAAHFWNGMVILQAPEDPGPLIRAAVAASGRQWAGIAGPFDQLQQVMPEILRTHPSPAMNGRDTLFSLCLDDLNTPGRLGRGDVTCRHPAEDELLAMIDLRIAFMQEVLGGQMRPYHEDEARDLVTDQQQAGNIWILEKAGSVVATTAVSAAVPGMIQVGGVYTLPGYRNQGYGRAVVAGSLIEARTRGVEKAILFTGTDMPAARAMYRALGFRQTGEYGLVIF